MTAVFPFHPLCNCTYLFISRQQYGVDSTQYRGRSDVKSFLVNESLTSAHDKLKADGQFLVRYIIGIALLFVAMFDVGGNIVKYLIRN